MIIRQEDIDPPPRDVIAEIQVQRINAFIEREIAGLAEFTGEEFARHVYRYPISFYYVDDEDE